jgi:hypothetical protein
MEDARNIINNSIHRNMSYITVKCNLLNIDWSTIKY